MDIWNLGARLFFFFVPFLFALCFHEFAHGLVAKMRGDNTAQMMGRLTLNPIVHMDLIGTLILPILAIILGSPISFGWAKPVPVNSRNLKKPLVDMFWIALAGPLSNIFLAVVGALALGLSAKFFSNSQYIKSIYTLLDGFIMVNLFLAFFNIIPLHPLDGGKVLARFLPAEVNYKLEQNEQVTSLVLMMLILGGLLSFLSIPVMWSHSVLIQLAGLIA